MRKLPPFVLVSRLLYFCGVSLTAAPLLGAASGLILSAGLAHRYGPTGNRYISVEKEKGDSQTAVPFLFGHSCYGLELCGTIRKTVNIRKDDTMNLTSILEQAVQEDAREIFLVTGMPITFRKQKQLCPVSTDRMFPADSGKLLALLYRLAGERSMERLAVTGEDEFSFAVPGLSRFRASTYKQRGSLSAVIRTIAFELPDFESLHIPETIYSYASMESGLVLICGPAGSGKTTTLACMVDAINRTAAKHILTLEDPLEYLHRHQKSIVSQREIRMDTETYYTALKSALRQSPDVIVLGEIPDAKTAKLAMDAADGGRLVLAAVTAPSAKEAFCQVVNLFPESEYDTAYAHLSQALKGASSQKLVSSPEGVRVEFKF